MKILIQMNLESDAIFGNGISVPGGEDIGIQTDSQGFPYLKGSTLKGIFREELNNYFCWQNLSKQEQAKEIKALMGESGMDDSDVSRKVTFSELTLHPDLIRQVRKEGISAQEITEIFTYLRTFTSLENGLVKTGSLRTARCIKKGLNFYGICTCQKEDAKTVNEVIQQIKWVGSMRSRGFGKVRVEGEEQKDEVFGIGN